MAKLELDDCEGHGEGGLEGFSAKILPFKSILSRIIPAYT